MIATLVPVRHPNIRCKLMYDLQNLSGAVKLPFLAEIARDKLYEAAEYLQENYGSKYRLLLWDAYRSRETQQTIYDDYKAVVKRANPELELCLLDSKTREFVNPPSGIFPHGCGGAVDVTLLVNEREADMGTGFDDFTPEAASAYYDDKKATKNKLLAKRHRRILLKIMTHAGFVPIASEWWHFEYGTHHWAKIMGRTPILITILSPPTVEDAASANSHFHTSQPALQSGVAQEFSDPKRRAESLAKITPAHHYGRTSHPTVAELEGSVKRLLHADHTWCIQSGLAACWSVITGLTPMGGRILYDQHIYYETDSMMAIEAKLRGWTLVKADFLNLEGVAERIKSEKFDLVFCDSPRNWLLDVLSVSVLAKLSRDNGAAFVVDTSVQPLQPAFEEPGTATIVSLTKYPSSGLDVGGAIVTNDGELLHRIKRAAEHVGHVLSPSGAFTILEQISWLPMRIKSLSEVAEAVKKYLDSHPAVRHVRIPDATKLGGLAGGQLSFHLHTPEQGLIIEKIVGHNSLSPHKHLNLLCTFGAIPTSIEFFDGNKRCREVIPREQTNEVEIPKDLVRLGLGCDAANDIIGDLEFVLSTSNGELKTINTTTGSRQQASGWNAETDLIVANT